MFSDYTVSGVATTRRDAVDKVTGRARYTADIRLPGMVYAKIVRPPAQISTPSAAPTTTPGTARGSGLWCPHDGLHAGAPVGEREGSRDVGGGEGVMGHETKALLVSLALMGLLFTGAWMGAGHAWPSPGVLVGIIVAAATSRTPPPT